MKIVNIIPVLLCAVGSSIAVSGQEPIDLTKDATYTMSSSYDAINVNRDFLLRDGKRIASTLGDYSQAFAFHTADEEDPFIVITLKKDAVLKTIEIENRQDGGQARAATLTIWVSGDKKEWKQVWTAKKAESKWIIHFEKEVRAKYIKMGLQERQCLHLNKVRVFGN